MSQQKIAQFVEQSKVVIADLQKVAADKTAEAVTAKAELQKIAETAAAEKASLRKLASETANYLLQQKVIAAGDLQKFAEGLAEPGAAHNMIRNLTVKLASAQAPIKVGKVSQQKVAESSDKLDSNALYEQRLHAAAGR
jgi:hypothetical protein